MEAKKYIAFYPTAGAYSRIITHDEALKWANKKFEANRRRGEVYICEVQERVRQKEMPILVEGFTPGLPEAEGEDDFDEEDC